MNVLWQNVPTEKKTALILSLAKKFGANLMEKDVPVRSSVENMVVELGLLSNLQASELLHATPNVYIRI